MKERQKQILIKDLCGRLPYGVKVQLVKEGIVGVLGNIYMYLERGDNGVTEIKCATRFYGESNIPIEEFKPYLRPLSSMTNEQMDKIEEILIGQNPYMVFDFLTYGDIVFHQANVSIKVFAKLIQFLDKEMLDYRGLIEQDLAIDATDMDIYNKEE